MLALDDQGSIVILRSEDVGSIGDLPRPYYFEGAMCSLFQVGCVRMRKVSDRRVRRARASRARAGPSIIGQGVLAPARLG